MTNPADAIKMLITYAVIIPLAIMVGYLLTDPLDYGTMFLFGVVAVVLFSPVFIRWHYPLLVFALSCPAFCFFLKGDPPFWQVMVMMSFGIAVVERTMSTQRRFISPPVMVWPFLFTVVMAYMTAKLTGGIGLKTLTGGDMGGVGGGKKYIELFLGVACFFALTSRVIPVERRRLYVALYFLGALPAFLSDLFPVLPSPFKYINLIFPPSGGASPDDTFSWSGRLGAFSISAGAIFNYMLARYGLRGIFLGNRVFRAVLFLAFLSLSLMGGFRIGLITNAFLLVFFFLLEGLHRTRLVLVVMLLMLVGAGVVVPFSSDLPRSVQRTLTILPLNLDPEVRMDADGSAQWRYGMWHDLWPKVPQYLLLGKGYALTAEDYEFMGNGQFAGGDNLDKSATGLAVSGDYHNGPLSTLIPFGIWGAISIIWLLATALYVTYRNYKYSPVELLTVNTYFFILTCWHTLCFFFVFGAYSGDVLFIGRTVGFSVALNWGIRAAKPVAASVRAFVPPRKRVSPPQPQAA